MRITALNCVASTLLTVPVKDFALATGKALPFWSDFGIGDSGLFASWTEDRRGIVVARLEVRA